MLISEPHKDIFIWLNFGKLDELGEIVIKEELR